MIGLCYNETYGAMTNHDDGEDDGYNNRNEDRNDDKNATSGSGSDGPISNPTTTPRSRLYLSEDDQAMTTISLRPLRHMYLRIGIYLPYKYPTNSIVNMCHKRMYAKIGVLDLRY